MTEEHKLREAASKGQKARRLMDNELLEEALTSMRDRALEDFKNAEIGDEKTLAQSHLKLRLIEEFAQELMTMVGKGRGAEKQIQIDEALKEAEDAKSGG